MPDTLMHRAFTTRVRLLTTAALMAVLTAACTQGDTADPLPSQPPTTTASTEPTQPSAPAAAPGGGAPTASASAPSTPAPTPGATETETQVVTSTCTLEPNQDGLPSVTLTYPSDWQVDDTDAAACRNFDPGDPSVEPATEASGVDVRAYVDAIDFARAAEPGPELTEASRLPTTVDGFQAVRVQGTTTGEGLGPAGTRRTTWIVDLDLGTDGDGGVLVIGASDRGADDYASAVDVADDIARSAVIGDQVVGAGTTIARSEGGGRPFTVVYRDGCVSLFAGSERGTALDEVCDLPADELAAVMLEDGDLRVVAGVTSPEADVVRLRSNTDAARAVAAVPLRNAEGRGFAMAMSGTETSVITETFDGGLVDQRQPVR